MAFQAERYLALIERYKLQLEQELQESIDNDDSKVTKDRLRRIETLIRRYKKRAAKEKAEVERKRIGEERQKKEVKWIQDKRKKLETIWGVDHPLSIVKEDGSFVLYWLEEAPGRYENKAWVACLDLTCDALGMDHVKWGSLSRAAWKVLKPDIIGIFTDYFDGNGGRHLYGSWDQVPNYAKEMFVNKLKEKSDHCGAIPDKVIFRDDWLRKEGLGMAAYTLFTARMLKTGRAG